MQGVSDLSAHTAIPGQSWNMKPCVSEARAQTLNPFALLALSAYRGARYTTGNWPQMKTMETKLPN